MSTEDESNIFAWQKVPQTLAQLSETQRWRGKLWQSTMDLPLLAMITTLLCWLKRGM